MQWEPLIQQSTGSVYINLLKHEELNREKESFMKNGCKKNLLFTVTLTNSVTNIYVIHKLITSSEVIIKLS